MWFVSVLDVHLNMFFFPPYSKFIFSVYFWGIQYLEAIRAEVLQEYTDMQWPGA